MTTVSPRVTIRIILPDTSLSSLLLKTEWRALRGAA
jgi:hypothetical protein